MDEQYLIDYLRLSKEDEEKRDESNSIINQRRVQDEYIKRNIQLQKYARLEFADDGYSGTNFERPGISKVLELVRKGKVACIIVKDLSRFGRDYIEVGYYLEHIFPAFGVRFIAINDQFDSDDFQDEVPGIDIAVKNIMNSYMSQDQSYKSKKSIYQQRKTGEHVGASAPYGYKKICGYGNKLFIDYETAFIVKRIFRMTLEGAGRSEIARILNMEGVLTPGDYKRCKKHHMNPPVKERDWSDAAISNILKNEAYIGTAISGQHYRPEMGKRYVKMAPRQQWEIVENAHPVIIGRDDFQKVQEGFKKTDHRQFARSNELLSGLLSCGHCKKALMLRNKPDGRYCYCDSHRMNPEYDCNRELIPLKDLEETVLTVIKSLLQLVNVNASIRKAESFYTEKNKYTSAQLEGGELKEDLLQIKKKMYEEYKKGKISLKAYKEGKEKLMSRCNTPDISDTNRKLEEEKAENIRKEFRNLAAKYKDIDCLTKEMLKDFVKRIYVYDKKHINIEFKYKDLFSGCEHLDNAMSDLKTHDFCISERVQEGTKRSQEI